MKNAPTVNVGCGFCETGINTATPWLLYAGGQRRVFVGSGQQMGRPCHGLQSDRARRFDEGRRRNARKRRWRLFPRPFKSTPAATRGRRFSGQKRKLNDAPASRGRATVAKSKPQMPWKKPELIMYSSVRFVPNTENSQAPSAGS